MFESEEQKKRAEVIVMLLAKLYIVLELSPDTCPLCHKPLVHDAECPIALAWSMLSPEQQEEARRHPRPRPQHGLRRLLRRPSGALGQRA